ncbi:cbb3-type cytochrome c oxidase N-terminal domain-containing protein [Gimesia panareensis]|nr:cbb3-type cytochrome c oxidase N-terminal domain-containing protein [Gimesia panareensis]
MMSEKDQLTTHNYDGIQEYDNPMPGWWVMLFWGCIFFAFPYWLYYESGVPGRSIYDQYKEAVADNLRLQFSEIGELKLDSATIYKYKDDPKWLKVGESVFQMNCVSCHGLNAEGKVGPNLTDDYWIHVKEIGDIAKVVEKGANGQAMPAWGNRLHPNEIALVAAYVASLRGSLPEGTGKPPGPKAKKIPPWHAPAAEEGKSESDAEKKSDNAEQQKSDDKSQADS